MNTKRKSTSLSNIHNFWFSNFTSSNDIFYSIISSILIIDFVILKLEYYYFIQLYTFFCLLLEWEYNINYILKNFITSKTFYYNTFVVLTVPLNLLFCIKNVSNNESFLFQNTILAFKATMKDTPKGGLHAHTNYNPAEWGSTTRKQRTRVSRRLAEDQVDRENPSIEPPPAPPALQTVDVPSGSAALVQVSGDVVSDVSLGTEPMDTDSIAPGNKTGSSFVETNSDAFYVTQRPPGYMYIYYEYLFLVGYFGGASVYLFFRGYFGGAHVSLFFQECFGGSYVYLICLGWFGGAYVYLFFLGWFRGAYVYLLFFPECFGRAYVYLFFFCRILRRKICKSNFSGIFWKSMCIYIFSFCDILMSTGAVCISLGVPEKFQVVCCKDPTHGLIYGGTPLNQTICRHSYDMVHTNTLQLCRLCATLLTVREHFIVGRGMNAQSRSIEPDLGFEVWRIGFIQVAGTGSDRQIPRPSTRAARSYEDLD